MQGSPAHVKHGAHFFYPLSSLIYQHEQFTRLRVATPVRIPRPQATTAHSARKVPQSPPAEPVRRLRTSSTAKIQKPSASRPPAAQHGISDILIRWENKSTRPAWMSKCRNPDGNGKRMKRESEGSMGVSPVWALITVSTRIRRN